MKKVSVKLIDAAVATTSSLQTIQVTKPRPMPVERSTQVSIMNATPQRTQR